MGRPSLAANVLAGTEARPTEPTDFSNTLFGPQHSIIEVPWARNFLRPGSPWPCFS